MEDQSSVVNSVQKADASSLSLKELFYKYIRFLPYFVLSVALALLLAFAYLRYTDRVYAATGSLQIKNQQANQRTDPVEDLISGSNRSQNIQSEIEVIKSRPVMARVVNRLGLQYDITALGRIRDRNVYAQAPFSIVNYKIVDSSRSFAYRVKYVQKGKFQINNKDGLISSGERFRLPAGEFALFENFEPAIGAEFDVAWHATETRARKYASRIKVQPKSSGTGILVISLEVNNPYLATDIVNNLMIQYDSLTIEQKNYSTDQKLAFIDSRLDSLKKELDSLQRIALDYKGQHDLIDVPLQSQASLARIDEANKTILQQELTIGLVEYITQYLQDKKNQFNQAVVPSSLGIPDIVLNDLVTGFNKAQLERKAMLEANIPPANPAIKELEASIEEQRKSLIENLHNLKLSYLENSARIRRNIVGEKGVLKDLPVKAKELVDLERQINTKLALYTLLEGKREESGIERAATTSNSTIVDRAGVSLTPVKPNKRTIQLIAILVGLALPAVVLFIIELLNDKITTRYDIEKITNAPIIGEVGHSYSENVLVVAKTSRTMVAEQFRTIRSNLDYIISKVKKPVILVTSSFSGEGKSFLSTNMGAVIGLAGKKTIVLEFDIRKPRVLTGLKMGKHKGIINYLTGNSPLDELILEIPGSENLYVLPCGPIPPNPSEMLLDSRVEELFSALRQQFDVIIIDTAPVGMVSDAMSLGKFADCTLYLTRQGHTFKKQISLIDEIYQGNKLPRISVVINDVRMKPGYGYYGYGRYGYGYGYVYGEKDSYYQEEPLPKTSLFSRIGRLLNPVNWFMRGK
ncbi:MAG: polysaccharide biosynthesis tyrosine autokinase [Chitinophagaceae bacterium]|nr:polysaccharide biosynthesis tyrosine autokinase [Chitinophagaceae bacterium]